MGNINKMLTAVLAMSLARIIGTLPSQKGLAMTGLKVRLILSMATAVAVERVDGIVLFIVRGEEAARELRTLREKLRLLKQEWLVSVDEVDALGRHLAEAREDGQDWAWSNRLKLSKEHMDILVQRSRLRRVRKDKDLMSSYHYHPVVESFMFRTEGWKKVRWQLTLLTAVLRLVRPWDPSLDFIPPTDGPFFGNIGFDGMPIEPDLNEEYSEVEPKDEDEVELGFMADDYLAESGGEARWFDRDDDSFIGKIGRCMNQDGHAFARTRKDSFYDGDSWAHDVNEVLSAEKRELGRDCARMGKVVEFNRGLYYQGTLLQVQSRSKDLDKDLVNLGWLGLDTCPDTLKPGYLVGHAPSVVSPVLFRLTAYWAINDPGYYFGGAFESMGGVVLDQAYTRSLRNGNKWVKAVSGPLTSRAGLHRWVVIHPPKGNPALYMVFAPGSKIHGVTSLEVNLIGVQVWGMTAEQVFARLGVREDVPL
jgi:hypothetical protein